MFKIKDKPIGGYSIMDERHWYLHSNGSIWRTAEYYPTREDAQAVLNKFQPKHEWVHGDVFLDEKETPMICLDIWKYKSLQVFCLKIDCHGRHTTEQKLENAKFLFNIGDKL